MCLRENFSESLTQLFGKALSGMPVLRSLTFEGPRLLFGGEPRSLDEPLNTIWTLPSLTSLAFVCKENPLPVVDAPNLVKLSCSDIERPDHLTSIMQCALSSRHLETILARRTPPTVFDSSGLKTPSPFSVSPFADALRKGAWPRLSEFYWIHTDDEKAEIAAAIIDRPICAFRSLERIRVSSAEQLLALTDKLPTLPCMTSSPHQNSRKRYIFAFFSAPL